MLEYTVFKNVTDKLNGLYYTRNHHILSGKEFLIMIITMWYFIVLQQKRQKRK